MFITVSEVVGIEDYRPWSGAAAWWDEVGQAGKQEELWGLICETFADASCSWTDINDFVWFEPDFYLPLLGLEDLLD